MQRPSCTLMWLALIVLVAGEALLEADQPKPRTDAQGDPLPAHAVARLGSARFRHQGLDQFAFSPDGKTLFTSGSDQTIRSFDVATTVQTHQFTYPEQFAAFADGQRVVLFTRDGQIRICDPATGKELGKLKAHPLPDQSSIRSPVQLLPDGKTAITAELPAGFTGIGNGYQYFFDLASGKETRRIGDKTTSGLDANILFPGGAVSPDGAMLATKVIHQTRNILWDSRNGQLLHSIELPDYATDLAFSADGKMLATTQMRTGDVILWDMGAGKEHARLKTETRPVQELRWVTFAPKGNRLAAVSKDGRIWVWDLTNRKLEHSLPGQRCEYDKPPFGPVFSPDGELLAARVGNTITLWNVRNGKPVDILAQEGHPHPVLDAVLMPDGKTAITRDKDAIRFWDLGTGKATRILAEPTVRMGLSRDGTYLVTLGIKHRWGRINGVDNFYVRGDVYEGPLKIWDPRGQRKTREIDLGRTCRAVVFGPDLSTLAVADWHNKVELWHVPTGESLQVWKEDRRGELFFAPDGRSMASTCPGMWLLKANNARPVTFPGDDYSHQVLFSPDGKTLGCWNKPTSFRLYDVATGKLQARIDDVPPLKFPGKNAFLPDGKAMVFQLEKSLTVRDAAMGKEKLLLEGIAGPWVASPDGMSLAAVLEDGRTIAVWNLATGKETRRLTGHRGKITCLTVHQDGRRLVSGSEDCTALVWDLKD